MADPVVTARSVATGTGPRGVYPPISVDVAVLAADTTASPVTVVPLRTNYKAVLTRVVFSVTTDAAQTATLKDSASTPVVLWGCKSSPGLGVIDAVFGEDGIEATLSKAITLTLSAAGLAGKLHIEGYYLPVGPLQPSGL